MYQIINSLLTTKELEYMKYLQFFNNIEEVDKVLEKNVFAYRLEKNIVIFQFQSVELYIKTKADKFDIKLIDLISDENDTTTSNQIDTIIQEKYSPITEESSYQYLSNLKSPRKNYGSKNYNSVSSIFSDKNNVNSNQYFNQKTSEISRKLLTLPIVQITDEILELKSEKMRSNNSLYIQKSVNFFNAY